MKGKRHTTEQKIRIFAGGRWRHEYRGGKSEAKHLGGHLPSLEETIRATRRIGFTEGKCRPLAEDLLDALPHFLARGRRKSEHKWTGIRYNAKIEEHLRNGPAANRVLCI